MKKYYSFLEKKSQSDIYEGFDPVFMPDFLFDFQQYLVDWSLKKGKAAIFADCGMGKTPIQLVWAENIVRKTNKRILIIAPLAVSHQTVEEGKKFGIECKRTNGEKLYKGINITNYERVHYFNSNDFVGVICDESSILKNFNGTRRSQITEFMKKLPYRLLCTATAAPNDYIELGTSSEALGQLGYMDMLNRFFKNEQSTINTRRVWALRGMGAPKWRFKGHAEKAFWKWVSSWARALRKPSDFGYNNDDFILPPLIEKEHLVKVDTLPNGLLFALPAIGLKEQREERNRTIKERCQKVAELVGKDKKASLIWCHLNAEGDYLAKIIKDSVQVSGKDSDDKKTEKLLGFANGDIKILITKPKIGGWGLNFQKCSHVTFFPSHSFEQYYQAVRRCWRFGQKNKVVVDIIKTDGDHDVLKNLQRKAKAADAMFTSLVSYMNDSLSIKRDTMEFNKKEEIPKWL